MKTHINPQPPDPTFMKTRPLLLSILALSAVHATAKPASPSAPQTREPSRDAGKIAADLFWVADSRKMDGFLATVPVAEWRNGAPTREVLPETTTAWRDYAAEARALARRGRTDEAAARLAQMVKLAAVYRAHGGLQNMVQAEEIRYLAGRTAAELGSAVSAKIQSPYLEKTADECLAIIESWSGAETRQVSQSFWYQFQSRAVLTHGRLSATSRTNLAAR